MTPEEQACYDKLRADYDALRLQLTDALNRQTCEGGQPYVCHALATARSRLAEAERILRDFVADRTADAWPAMQRFLGTSDSAELAHHDLCASLFHNYTHKAQAALEAAGEWPPSCNCTASTVSACNGPEPGRVMCEEESEQAIAKLLATKSTVSGVMK